MWFCNHYQCPSCSTEWNDEWSATCDDDCPACHTRHIAPTDCDDLTIIIVAELDRFVVLRSSDEAEHEPDYRPLASFSTRDQAEAYLDLPRGIA